MEKKRKVCLIVATLAVFLFILFVVCICCGVLIRQFAAAGYIWLSIAMSFIAIMSVIGVVDAFNRFIRFFERRVK